jgi:hypothetical protein
MEEPRALYPEKRIPSIESVFQNHLLRMWVSTKETSLMRAMKATIALIV